MSVRPKFGEGRLRVVPGRLHSFDVVMVDPDGNEWLVAEFPYIDESRSDPKRTAEWFVDQWNNAEMNVVLQEKLEQAEALSRELERTLDVYRRADSEEAENEEDDW